LPHPPQQLSRIISQIIEEHPPLLLFSHPHPQFVAAKSLILIASMFYLFYGLYYEGSLYRFPKKIRESAVHALTNLYVFV
jgi:hypothetical protein